ncbi:8466_t:CDS:2, partial [Racocetra persica]
MASFININSDTDDTFEEIDFNEINKQSDDDNIEEIAYFTKNLTARHIQFSAISVEYPPTDLEGYAIIYNFIDNENYSEERCKDDIQIQKLMRDKARVVFHDIQYSQSGKGGSSNINCPFFDKSNNEKVQVIKDQQKCEGVNVVLWT